MKTYLVVYDQGGAAQIENIAIVKAFSTRDAKEIICKERAWPDPRSAFKLRTFELDTLQDGWSYFT